MSSISPFRRALPWRSPIGAALLGKDRVTEDLIRTLADAAAYRPPSNRRLVSFASLGAVAVALSLAIFLFGPRPDLSTALATGGFWLKFAYPAAVAVVASLAVARLGRPDAATATVLWLAVAASVALAAVASHEVLTLPAPARLAALMGHSWRVCSLRIGAISLPGFGAILLALRMMAPTNARLAGAAAGLLAGALGAAAYSLTCNETSLAFLAGWYSLGMLAWVVAGALLGPRLLRW